MRAQVKLRGYKCPRCGYLKPPEEWNGVIVCVGCQGVCIQCKKMLPRPGTKRGVVIRFEAGKLYHPACLT
mgnify:CR=1 FL=1